GGLAGADGSRGLRDDPLVLAGGTETERQWPCPPALSNGSVHPDWFVPVAGEFVAEATGRGGDGANLAEASLCVLLESLARESSRRDGETLPVPPVGVLAPAERA